MRDAEHIARTVLQAEEGDEGMTWKKHSYEEQTLRSIANLTVELRALEAIKKELEDKVIALTKEVNAYELILQSVKREKVGSHCHG